MKIKKMLTKRWKILLKASEQRVVIADNHRRIAEARLRVVQDFIAFQTRTANLFEEMEGKHGAGPA